MSKISEILHKIFSEDAIYAAAYAEQTEDIKYCIKNHMAHLNGKTERLRWEKHQEKANLYYEKDMSGDQTFTAENIKKFFDAVHDVLSKNSKLTLYEGLSEIEHYAVRRFYYNNCY